MGVKDGVTLEWTVSGMDCPSCAGNIRGAVEYLPGVSEVDVGIVTERAPAQPDPEES